MKWTVEVVEHGTNRVEHQIPSTSESQAETVDSGVNRQLDHEKYFTRVTRE